LLYPINIFTTVGFSPAVSVKKKFQGTRKHIRADAEGEEMLNWPSASSFIAVPWHILIYNKKGRKSILQI
jgi:hypothetical protein